MAVTGNISAGNVSATTFTGALSGAATSAGTAGTVTTNAQGNITSVGTLTSLGVSGNITASNITANTGVFSGNGSSLTALNANNVSSGTLAQARLANASVTLGSTALTLGSTVTTVAGLTSVTSTTFVGALTGAASSATTAGTVTTNAQPNITSVGTLTSLTVGNATANSIFGNGTITAITFTGAHNGTVGATTANTGAFTTISATGQITSTLAAGTAPFVVTSTTQVANLNVATAGVAGTVTAASQPNITGVGTLASLTVTNTITGSVSGSAATAGTAGTVTTNAQPNITSVGTLTGLGVNGTITGANITANTGVFTGNGSGLSALNASNVSSGTLPAARLSGTYTITVSGSATSAGTAGTVTTNAQPNITSTGTLSSLTVGTGGVHATGSGNDYNVAGVEVIGNGATNTVFPTIGFHQPSLYASSIQLRAGGDFRFYVQGAASYASITAASVNATTSVITPLLTTGANTTPGTVTGNWTLSAGSRWNASYADLSEKYVADANYGPGTVLVFGGEHEVTISTEMNTTRVAGVITTDAAYTMNSGLEAEFIADIALQGRVPCKVIGPVFKGDLLVAAGNGHAIANNEARAGTIIGKSLENFNEASGVIEVAVGRF